MPKEIERKWLLSSIDVKEYDLISETKVEQAYVSENPEVRIRNENNTEFSLTLKDNGTVDRVEVQIPITAEQYTEILNEMIQKPPIVKIYRKYRLPNDLILEVSDVDDGAFFYAEVEFSSIEKANSFLPAFEFLKEVSENPEYRMRAYWTRTRS
jgi:Uncharacterized protein conserved in bacteria